MYKLKKGVNFKRVNEKSIMKFDFDLSPYYDEKTRQIKTPERYIDFSCMGQVFVDFLIPLNLVEKVEELKESDD